MIEPEQSISIRRYHVDDKVHVIHLLRLNTPKYFTPKEEQDLIYYLENEIEDYFVLEKDGKIISAGGINLKGGRVIGYLSWDIVDPESQGKGFGSLLVKHRIKLLNENPKIETIIVRTTQLAYKYYEKCGFKLVDQVKDYWASGFDLYLMEFVN
jgi:ribosomal-protein-alanine N-acetyltransferase